ncbi:exonuclease domain-containing protein [[Kitasatospora] papulosa]|uniref:exonuclease domain-containing protein n=1 Tax=Streptomyces TaxID=1883 RepID=UPI002FF3D58C
MNTWHRRPLIGLDLETTGVDPETDRIVTGSVVRFGGGAPTDGQSWLSDAGGVEIPAGATAVHGITTAAARSAGRPAGVVVAGMIDAVVASVADGLPLVAMNATFDLTMLDREARRHGVVPLVDRATPYVLDPKVLDKRADRFRKGGRTLTDLCRHYVVPLDGAHTSDADAVAACAVTWKLTNRYRWLARMSLAELHSAQVLWAAEQAAELRAYFERTPGKEDWVGGVRLEWPILPAPRVGDRTCPSPRP